jgi:hypothetical protein
MGRFFQGFIAAGTVQTRSFAVLFPPFNSSGDWGAAYQLAHPQNPGATLVSTSHSKTLNPTLGAFFYAVTVTNTGPLGTLFDIDF